MNIPVHICPLCKKPAELKSTLTDICVTCEHCGRFLMDPWLPDVVDESTDAYLVSGATRNSDVRGDTTRLTSDNLDALKSLAPSDWDVGRKYRLLLRHLARMSGYPSRTANLRLENDYPLCYAHDADECGFFLNQLLESKWVTCSSGDGGRRVTLTPLGWLESHTADPRESSKTFIAMWFAPEMTQAYSDGIEPGVLGAGYTPIRIDREEHNNMIDDAIQAEIKESRFLVADLTGHRNGVYFEAGFALGLGMPVIWTCRKDEAEKAHFDTRQYNRIEWTTAGELRERLELRIRATIGRGQIDSRPELR